MFCSAVMSVRSNSVTYLSCVIVFCSAVMSVRSNSVTYLSCVIVFWSAVMSVRADNDVGLVLTPLPLELPTCK